MEQIIALLEKRRTDMKDAFFNKPTFVPEEVARRVGAVEELGQVLAILENQRRAHDEDDERG